MNECRTEWRTRHKLIETIKLSNSKDIETITLEIKPYNTMPTSGSCHWFWYGMEVQSVDTGQQDIQLEEVLPCGHRECNKCGFMDPWSLVFVRNYTSIYWICITAPRRVEESSMVFFWWLLIIHLPIHEYQWRLANSYTNKRIPHQEQKDLQSCLITSS